MGNITQLSQGNLEGLKKQVCECIDHAHEQGYKQGFINCKKSYPFTEEEVNKVANDEYNKGYADGNKEGYDNGFEQGKKQATSELPELANKENEMYNRGYNTAIDDYNMMIEWWNNNSEDFGKFLFEVYGLADCRYKSISLLCDIIYSWDMQEVIDEFKKWQEQKKQDEEDIILGDVVYYKGNPESEFFVFKIEDNLISGINTKGEFSNKPKNEWKKTGKNFFELVRYVNKAFSIKGENQDE